MNKFILTMVAMLTLATSAVAQIGSLSSDLVFTPLTPCRIVDTRVAGGSIAANSARGFKAWGASFAAQGGSATPCGIPQNTNVAALELNLVAVTPAAAGYITAYPTGVAQPTASTLNYAAADIVANGATVKVSQATPSLASDWTVYSFAATHFLADVTGYYSRPISNGSLECMDTSLVSVPINSGPVNSLYFNFLAPPSCPVGYTQVSLHCMVGDSTSSASELISGNCNGTSPAIGAILYASKTCCRIPGR